MDTEREFVNALNAEEDKAVYQRILAVKLYHINEYSTREISDMLNRAPSWVSDCLTRYKETGLSGLQTKPKSGRPRLVTKETLEYILNQHTHKQTTPIQIRQAIFNTTTVYYSIGYVRKILHQYNITPKKPQLVHAAHSSSAFIKKWQKKIKRQISYLKSREYEIFQADEAMFSSVISSNKKGWIYRGIKWYSKHGNRWPADVIFGFVSESNHQMFRIFDKFNSETFLKCVKQLVVKYSKIAIILDNARPHHSKKVKEYLKCNKNVKLIYLPVASPEHNAVESCWKKGKYDLSGVYFETKEQKRNCLSEYYRTQRFDLSIMDFIFRKPIVFGNI